MKTHHIRTIRYALAFAVGLSLPITGICADAVKSQTVKLDPKASVLHWRGKKVTGEHDGTVQLKKGEVKLSKGAITGGSFDVDMTTIDNSDITNPGSKAKLVGHLKSADFFEVDKHPTAKFKITSVKPMTEAVDGMTHEITGDLTIKGVTKPITFPATVAISGGMATAKGTMTIDRTLYNIKYGSGKFFEGLGDKVIYDEFTVDLNLVGKL